MFLPIALCALQVSTPATAADIQRPPTQAPGPNIIVLVADDFGVDLMGAYAEGAAPPCTQNIDALAANGLLFRNAWANPTCSPTRASLMTGRHGFRTGVGAPLTNQDDGLLPSETTIPELLTGYHSTAVGKWHLHGNQGNLHPNITGFDHYAGGIRGALSDYFQWPKITNGQTGVSTTYATLDTANDAITAIHTAPEPWFLYVSFNAPHTPPHHPPATSCDPVGCATNLCANLPTNATVTQRTKAMCEAMDYEIGRVFAALRAASPDAYIIFMGDNGTARGATEAPFVRNHAKGTMYEGGINVPLVISGPGIRPGECSALVSVTDIYATIAELARRRESADDSISLVPYFRDPNQSLRASVYSETFSPSGGPPPYASHRRAVRDSRYKLIRETGELDELYDLAADPFEATNLLPTLTTAQQSSYDFLVAELVALGVD